MVDVAAVAAVAVVAVVVLLGGWLRGDSERKYDDPDAQRAHERPQRRDPSATAPVGMETTMVVQELVDDGQTARVSLEGLYVFVEAIPDGIATNDSIEIKITITDHAPDGNAARATFLSRA